MQVEHVARNVRVSEIPHVRLAGSTTIIPIVEEVLVVEKSCLVEEIISAEQHVRDCADSGDVRREQARTERTVSDGQAAGQE